MIDRHAHIRLRNLTVFRGLQELWSTRICALIVAAGLMAPIGIQVAFSAPDEVTARAGLPGPERYPDRGEPVGAGQKSEINGIDFDLSCLLAWHASAYAREFLRDGFDCAILAPR
jgi:hypothetical protein